MTELTQSQLKVELCKMDYLMTGVEENFYTRLWLLPDAAPGAMDMRERHASGMRAIYSSMITAASPGARNGEMSMTEAAEHLVNAQTIMDSIISSAGEMEDIVSNYSVIPGLQKLSMLGLVWSNSHMPTMSNGTLAQIDQDTADALGVQFGEYANYHELLSERENTISKSLDAAATIMHGGEIVSEELINELSAMINQWWETCDVVSGAISQMDGGTEEHRLHVSGLIEAFKVDYDALIPPKLHIWADARMTKSEATALSVPYGMFTTFLDYLEYRYNQMHNTLTRVENAHNGGKSDVLAECTALSASLEDYTAVVRGIEEMLVDSKPTLH